MNIDNIALPPFLCQKFFGNNLVDLEAGFTKNAATKEVEISFLGGNEKKIIFLFSDSHNKFLADAQAKLLYNLVTACELTMADVAFVNFFHNNTITHRDLASRLQAKRILIFGIPASSLDLPFTIPFFQMQTFGDQVYMISPSVEELQTNKDLRNQLWVCLQKIFNIRKPK
jgi:hypothetical protein